MPNRRSFIGSVLVALLGSQALISDYNTVQPVVYKTGMNPGMALRLEQSSLVAFKSAM